MIMKHFSIIFCIGLLAAGVLPATAGKSDFLPAMNPDSMAVNNSDSVAVCNSDSTALCGDSVRIIGNEALLRNFKVKDFSHSRQGDELVVTLNLDLKDVHVRRNRAWEFTPSFVKDSDSIALVPMGVYGRRRYFYYVRNFEERMIGGENEIVFRQKNLPDTLLYSVSLPYRKWLNGSELILRCDEYGCCRSVTDSALTHFPGYLEYVPEYFYIRPAVELVKVRSLSGSAFIDFPVNRTEIRPTYRNNERELAKIIATIDSVKGDSDITVQRLDIKGFASPEGSYANNVRLARGRTDSLKAYVERLYAFPDSFIRTSFEPEDWAGLRAFVAARGGCDSALCLVEADSLAADSAATDRTAIETAAADSAAADSAGVAKPAISAGILALIDSIGATDTLQFRSEILALIDSSMEPDEKDLLLRRLYPADYRILLRSVYPALRHSDYCIEYTIRTFTDTTEILDRVWTQPQKLSLNEMFIAARNYPEGSEEYRQIMETAVRFYPNDTAACFNAANIAIQRGDRQHAEYYMNRCDSMPQVIYLRGVLAAIDGEYETARTFFEPAAAAGIEEAVRAIAQLDAIKQSHSLRIVEKPEE